MEGVEAHLSELYTQYSLNISSTNNEAIQGITNEIVEMYKDPSILPCILSIASKTTNSTISEIACTGFISITRNEKKIDPELILEIMEPLIGLIQTEKNEHNKLMYIERAISLIQYANPDMLNSIIELAQHFLEDVNTLSCSLRAWLCLLEVPSVFAQNLESFQTVLSIAISGFSAESESVRREAYLYAFKCLSLFLDDEVESDAQDSLHDAIFDVLGRAASLSQYEATDFFKDLSLFIKYQICFVEDNLMDVIQAILELIADKEIPLEIREVSFQVLSEGFKNFGDVFVDDMPEFLETVLLFTFELAEEIPDEKRYLLTDDFFVNAALAVESSGNDITEFFTPIILQLIESEDPKGYLAAFMIFTAISDVSQYTIAALYSDIEGIIEESLQADSILLNEAALEFLRHLCRNVGTLAPKIQEKFESTLYQCASNDIAIQTLTSCYEAGQTAPSSVEEAVGILLDQLRETNSVVHHEVVLDLITQIVLNAASLEETIYPAIKEYIFELVGQGGSSAGRALVCFSSFAFVQPTAIIEDIASVIPILQDLIASNDNEAICDSATAAINLLTTLPSSMEPAAGDLFGRALEIASLFKQNQEEEEENEVEPDMRPEADEEDFKNMKSEANYATSRVAGIGLDLAATIFEQFTSQLAEQAESLTDRFTQLLSSDTDIFDLACDASVKVISGLASIEQPMFPIINSLLDSFVLNQDEYFIQKLWSTLAAQINECPPPVIIENLNDIAGPLVLALEGRAEGYSRRGEKGRLNPDLVRPILDTLEEVLIVVGQESAPLMEAASAPLLRLLRDKDPLVRTYAAATTALAASVFPENEELFDSAHSVLAETVAQDFSEVKEFSLLGFAFLALSDASKLSGEAPALRQQCAAVFGDGLSPQSLKGNASALFGALFSVGLIHPAQNEVELALSEAPKQPNSFLLKFSAAFAVKALASFGDALAPLALRIAVPALASRDSAFSRIGAEERRALAELISGAQEGAPEELARNVESAVALMHRHVEESLQ